MHNTLPTTNILETTNTMAACSGVGSSLIAQLRQLVPRRRLSYSEALTIAELQANKLRQILGLSEQADFPTEHIEDLPHIKVERTATLPTSGMTHWRGNHWLILLNSADCEARQRFSLAHEFKHILDHTTKSFSCWDEENIPAESKAEAIADYFAGCLLMPKRHLKHLWGINRKPAVMLQILADAFGASPLAISVRLRQVGLCQPGDWHSRSRCPGLSLELSSGLSYKKTSTNWARSVYKSPAAALKFSYNPTSGIDHGGRGGSGLSNEISI